MLRYLKGGILAIIIALPGILVTCTKDNLYTDPPNTIKVKVTQEAGISFEGVRVNSVSVDEFNQIWFATDIGLFLYKDGAFSKLEINGISKVNDVFYYNSEIIASTDNGVILIDVINGEIHEKALQLNRGYSSIISNVVNTSFINDRNVYWFGTDIGPCMLHDTTWTDTLDKNVNEVNVSSFTNRGTDYFMGTIGSYLYHFYYDDEIDAVTRASKMEIGYNGNLTSDTIYDVFTSHDDYLWFGSSKGLTKQKGQTKTWNGEFYYFLLGKEILTITEDNNSDIWAGSYNGIWKQVDTTWQNISVEDGLAGNTIYSIAIDDNNDVWVGTNNGISNIKGDLIKNY